MLLLSLVACSRASTGASDAAVSEASAPSSFDPAAIARAEDLRHAKDVPPESRTSHDPHARRRTARALARIADAASIEGLTAHLADEDPETVSWAAYGLGYACKGREESTVKMLAARAASLGDPQAAPKGRGAVEIEPHVAIARAMGRCGGTAAEQALVALLKTGAPWENPALLGLGDLAARKKQLGADAMTALLELVARKEAPRDLAFYPLSRADAGETFGKRVVEVARPALARSGEMRILAIKALGRAKDKESAHEAAADLAKIVVDTNAPPGERAEAGRALAGLPDAGLASIADCLAKLTPDTKDPIAITNLGGPSFHVLYTLLAALSSEAPKKAEPALQALATLVPPSEPKPGLARRLAEIRCSAALALAKGAYDADVLKKCDADTSEISQKARLTSLLRRKIEGERRGVFRTFTKSDHLRVREDAVEALGAHPEVPSEVAVAILSEALTSKHAGLVATAAEVLIAHPERALVLAESEKKAALDPKAPPPTANPAQEVAPAVAKALVAALNEKWPEDRFETRMSLIEAAAAVRIPQARHVAQQACNDANGVVRERALKALRSLGESIESCKTPADPKPAAEIGQTIAKDAKVVFKTDAGAELTVFFEPELSPITATRLTALAKSGFFKGIVVHRVVPGFVVQFGDPDGDGYGGSNTSLRCETSPVPFRALDVGMALAGRDTGSSQIFVTLSRTPHLDGEYTRVGRAEGDWSAVAQGDVITEAIVTDN